MEEKLTSENNNGLPLAEADQNSICTNSITQLDDTVNYLPPLEAALAYAQKGFKVFPVIENDKKPATKHGFYDASDDLEVISKWWGKNPHFIPIPE